MAPEGDKFEKQNTTTETQENSPDVSVDTKTEKNKKQQEQEEDETKKSTAINLLALQKKIEVIKTSNQYSKEIKDQAVQIEHDLTTTDVDQTIITTKTKEVEELEKKKKPETLPQKIRNRFKKTTVGVNIARLFKKRGLGDIFGSEETATEQPKIASTAPASNPEPQPQNPEIGNDTPPEVDAASIDDAIQPNEEKHEEEKKPEMSKDDVEKGVNQSMDNFWTVAKSIDSDWSMFTKNDKDIASDGVKLDAAYQQVLDQLKHISEFYPEDGKLQELMRKTMEELAMFYRDKAKIDNDHHVDPVKAAQLLIPAVSEIEDITGQKPDFPAMPSQDALMQEIANKSPKIAERIAEDIAKGLTMDQILEDKEIKKEWDTRYKDIFDKREGKFDNRLAFIYDRYKAGKCPNLTPSQIKSLEALKDLQGVADWRDRKDRNVAMTKNIAAGIGAIAAGIAVTVFTAGTGSAGGVAGVSVGSALLSAAVGGAVTTVGLWANENKWIGGTELAGNFVLNAAPFGVGKVFSYFREGAVVATNVARAMRVGSYLAEGAVDVSLMSGVQAIKGESFTSAVEQNIAWAIFPLLLHEGAPALKSMKSSLVTKLFARKALANETLTELNKAKILAQLGKKQLSQEILDKLNTKLNALKRNETFAVLEEQTALVEKKQGLVDEIAAYMQENRVGIKAKLPIKSVSSGFIDNFNQVGDKLVVVNTQGARKQITLIKFDGKNSIVSIDGASATRANLTGGKLSIKDPIFRGDNITGSYLAKHPNPRGVDANALITELQTTKTDLANVKALSVTFEAFAPQMTDVAQIYPQMQRDLRNLRKGGKAIDDFVGYKVQKTDGGFEITDPATGNATTVKNSGEVLSFILPKTEATGQRLLTYKLSHLYDNMTPDKLQKILERGKNVKKIAGQPSAYEINIDGVTYQASFDKAAAQKVIFKDAAGQIIDEKSPIIRSLESKVFADISSKYRTFAKQCADIKTPLGKLIPDAMKPKMLQALADKLHKPIVVIENMTVGPVLEACEKFADMPTFRNFTRIMTGGGGLNTLFLTGILMIDATQNKRSDIGPDYVKYVLGGTLAPLVGIASTYLNKKIDEHKGSETKGERFT